MPPIFRPKPPATVQFSRFSPRRIAALSPVALILLGALLAFWLHARDVPFWLMLIGSACLISQSPSVLTRRAKRKNGAQNRAKGGARIKLIKPIDEQLLDQKSQSAMRPLQIGVFLLLAGGLYWHYGREFNTDFFVSFLLLCLIGKSFELITRRDGYIMLNLALFVLAATFLWGQSPARALAAMIVLAVVLLGFIALSDSDNKTGAGRLKMLGLLMLPAMPLLVVLFLFFPRVPPLWSLNLGKDKSISGVSDSMSPGDFAQLSKSTELAFRAKFDTPPSRDDLYWRGLVFSDFDGTTWRPAAKISLWNRHSAPPDWAQSYAASTQDKHAAYTISLQPTRQKWLFALDYSHVDISADLTDKFTFVRREPINQPLDYTAQFYPNATTDSSLNAAQIAENTQLPDGNPQARALAKSLNGAGDVVQYIQNVRQYMQDNQFSYTLSPPQLGSARVDDFLFGSKAGFCEHYASSFVFLMRAQQIPARVVAGYQGGELSLDKKTWEVRQMDAHAWAEVWIDGRGWTRVDPTAFVSPDRIDTGMDALTDRQNLFGAGIMGRLGQSQFKLLQSLGRLSSQLDFYWQDSVVGFDSESQSKKLTDWFNIGSKGMQILLMAAAVALMGALWAAFLWRRRQQLVNPFDRAVASLSARLAKKDAARARRDDETELAFLTRVAGAGAAAHYRHWRFGRAAMLMGGDEFARAAAAFAQQLQQVH